MSTVEIGARFGRADVADLLNIPQWLLANFADRRYPYGLAPCLPGGKGRGQKGLYTIWEVYKIALAYRMWLADLNARVIGEAIRELFPEGSDPRRTAVTQRAKDEAHARCVLIDLFQFSKGTWMTELPHAPRSVVPSEWKGEDNEKREWVSLCVRNSIADKWRNGTLRAMIAMPFDETLNWVDSQVLGRPVTFAHRANTNDSEKGN